MKHCTLCLTAAALLAGASGVAFMGGFTATQNAAPAAPTASAEAFAVDAVHSSVLFRVKHNNVSNFYGRFNKFSGSFLINLENPESSNIDVTIDVDSIDTANQGRDRHLKNDDFFSATQFPTATFKSKSFKKTGDKTLEVTGDLTIRGVTKPITATLEHTGAGQGRGGVAVEGFEAKFTFNRGDFGVNYMLDKGLSNEVAMIVSLQGGRK